MRYVKKAAQKEITDYYNYCIEKYYECLDNGYEEQAGNWAGKIAAIENIYDIIKRYGYTK